MTNEKRRATRQPTTVLAHLERKDAEKKRSALIDDISSSGAHLLTREKLSTGDKVNLALHLSDAKVIETSARVVRVSPRDADRASLWTHNVGVEFDAPIPELDGAEVPKK